MDVDGALTRVLPICQEEEEDEDNIPGAKQILGRGSPCESKHSTGSRHHQSHPKKSLADVKPVSYPNHLNNASSQQPSTVIQSQNSVGDLSSCSSSKKSPRSVNAVHGHHHHHKQCVHPPAMGSKQDAKCSVMWSRCIYVHTYIHLGYVNLVVKPMSTLLPSNYHLPSLFLDCTKIAYALVS